VVVERIAVERLGVEQELAALGARDRGGDTDLAAELVGVVDFALVDALDLGVQRIDLRLRAGGGPGNAPGAPGEQVGEALPERRIAPEPEKRPSEATHTLTVSEEIGFHKGKRNRQGVRQPRSLPTDSP
jgi:hypothetical protein